MSRISVVIHTRNEEKMIEGCLQSVADWAAEIIVVDMQSTDRTVEICRRYTDKIFEFEHLGYADPARNFAVAQATCAWILVIDADERIPPRLAERLVAISQTDVGPDDPQVYELPMRHIIFGHWMRYAGYAAIPGYTYHIRFFRAGSITFQDEVHSRPIVHQRMVQLAAAPETAMLHHSHPNITAYLDKANRYTSFEASQKLAASPRITLKEIVLAPLQELWYRLIKARGYLDGTHGVVLCILMAFYRLQTVLKIWELQQRAGGLGSLEHALQLDQQDLGIFPGASDIVDEAVYLAQYRWAQTQVHGPTLLDVGCGSGHGTALLTARAPCILGSDPSAEAVSYAQAKYQHPHLTFVQSEGAALPLPNQSIHTLLCFTPCRSIADQESFWQEARRILHPGGRVLLAVPHRRVGRDHAVAPIWEGQPCLPEIEAQLRGRFRAVERSALCFERPWWRQGVGLRLAPGIFASDFQVRPEGTAHAVAASLFVVHV